MVLEEVCESRQMEIKARYLLGMIKFRGRNPLMFCLQKWELRALVDSLLI